MTPRIIRYISDERYLTCSEVRECRDHTGHATPYGHVTDLAPIAPVPQSNYVLPEGQQEGLKGGDDRARNVPPSASLMASFLQQTHCGQTCRARRHKKDIQKAQKKKKKHDIIQTPAGTFKDRFSRSDPTDLPSPSSRADCSP